MPIWLHWLLAFGLGAFFGPMLLGALGMGRAGR